MSLSLYLARTSPNCTAARLEVHGGGSEFVVRLPHSARRPSRAGR